MAFLEQNVSLSNLTNNRQRLQGVTCTARVPLRSQQMNSSYELNTLWVTSLINVMTILPSITGNFFVLLFLCWKPQLRSNSHLILGCLATTDLLVGVIVQPLLVAFNLNYLVSNVSPSLCNLYVVYDIIKYVCGLCSSCVSILVTADRSLAVGHPYVYTMAVTKTRVIVACILTWILCTTLTVLRVIFSSGGRSFALLFIVMLSISFFVVATLYVKMLRIANRHRLEINTQDRLGATQQCRERKALKTALIIIGVYFVCYFPYIIGRLYFINVKVKRTSRYLVMLWPKTLLYVNSSLNPIILFWRTKKLRKALGELIRILCRRGRASTASNGTLRLNRALK